MVRLRQGDFDRERVYADDPAEVAREFAAQGAGWLHVVDLDGARAGERRQAAAIQAVVAAIRDRSHEWTEAPQIQVAGGLRDGVTIDAVLDAGVDRVAIGTAALRDPAMVAAVIERHSAHRVVVALDVRDGRAIGDGWVAGATGVAIDVALASLSAIGVTTFAVTAIERDGLLGGPDLELLARCVDQTGAAVLASGGIRSTADLEAVRAVGCSGAIVGRALYDGTLALSEALRVERRVPLGE